MDTSPSSRGRGLKSKLCGKLCDVINVALFTRAWIEINKKWILVRRICVALFTRAWIEILTENQTLPDPESPSSRGRGLKSMTEYGEEDIKLSPSSRGRGLKYNITAKEHHVIESPSSRGRGLKCMFRLVLLSIPHVALFTRAWIEIVDAGFNFCSDTGRPLHEGVD